jgi:hypothetical protein
MKTTIIAALAALATFAATPLLAQAPAPAAPMAAATGAMGVDKTPIETIVANPAAKAVLDKDLPGLTSHEAYDQFKGMTLTQLAPMSQGAITDDRLKVVQADLDKLK